MLVSALLLVSLWGVPAGAVTQEWARTYDGGGMSDEAKDIAVDAAGNVYVTGWSFIPGIIAGEYMTIMYDSAGNQLWATAYDGPQPNGNDGATSIAVDSSGNSYVTGYSPSNTGGGVDIVTVKYNSLGVQQWAARYDNQGKDDQGNDVTVDSTGNVYVTGMTGITTSTNWDIVTIKYNSLGVQQWARVYTNPWNGFDAGYVIGETGGFVYVGGTSTVGAAGTKDYITIKYNSLGNMQPGWPQIYSGIGNDIIHDLRLDSSGNVYVTGEMTNGIDLDCMTVAYNSSGIVLWSDWYNNGMNDAGQAIELDNSGNIYVAGYSEDNPATKVEFFTRKISSLGVQQWTQRYDGGVPIGYPVLVDVDVDNQSPANVYITGNSRNALNNWDYTTVMYDSLGSQKWAISYDPASQNDEPRGIAVYDANSIYVTGYTWGDFGTVKYSQRTQTGPSAGQHLKWSQPPVEIYPLAPTKTFCGWDEKSFNWDIQNPNGRFKIVADDFRCLGSMPVTSIHWWGSYYGWDQGSGLPPVVPTMWWIGFWSNMPAGMATPYSFPNQLLHSFTVPAQRVQMNKAGTDQYFTYYPYDTCYEYYLPLQPQEVFRQNDFNDVTMDQTFWLSIVAIYPQDEPYFPWGWKTRPWHWMDDAVTFNLPLMPAPGYINIPPVTPLVDPMFQESMDVSFELDTDPNYIKWEQPFTGIRNWPNYQDVNSLIVGGDPAMNQTIVADDWKCLRRTPITAVVWWGSYIGYNYHACSQTFMPLPVKPDRFKLTIWTDVPVSDPCNTLGFSYPGQAIWQYTTAKYDEVLVGNDKDPLGQAFEPVFRYSVRLPKESWFQQPGYEQVYWLSVQAVYSPNTPNYLWGWTNHKHFFNDDAIQMRGGSGPGALWMIHEIFDQTGESADMSFMLFTDPTVCSTCANYNCDTYVNFVDFAIFAKEWYWTGSPGGYKNADLNCDGTVDFKDLGIFCMQWLTHCP
jgi:hypothetical protein